MSTSYPNEIKYFASKTDAIDDVRAEDINNVQNEIMAIQNELGTNPKGEYSNVRLRIENIETDIVDISASLTTIQTDIVDISASLTTIQTDVVDISALLTIIQTGWIPSSIPWSYASSTTFTISGDVRNLFPKGTKIKLTQTTTKYFYVIDATYASPNTTITITGGDDYSLSNAAISNAYYSYATSPQGFPGYFNYTPTWTSTGTQPSLGNGTLNGRFWIQGNGVNFWFELMFGSTTSGGTGNWRFALPTPALSGIRGLLPVNARDAGVNSYPRFAVVTDQAYSGSYIEMFLQLDNQNNTLGITSTSPFTWGTGDYLTVGPGFYLL